jgi:polyferredoxin
MGLTPASEVHREVCGTPCPLGLFSGVFFKNKLPVLISKIKRL